MENKMTKFFKIFFTLLAVLIFGMCGGLIVTVNADTVTKADSLTIKMSEYRTYNIYPDGYKVDNSSLTPFVGDYVLTGEPSEDVTFRSYGEPVTYNVILHSISAISESWYGMMGVEPNVTLNITVYGDNEVRGYNHPGISLSSGDKEGHAPIVNITMTDGSKLTVGCNYHTTNLAIAKGIEVNLSDGATSSVDMSIENWQSTMEITFTNGKDYGHSMSYSYAGDEICRYECNDCDIISVDEAHYTRYAPYSTSHEDYSTKHTSVCRQCLHDFDSSAHNIDYNTSEQGHEEYCYMCGYRKEFESHEITNGSCTVCGISYLYKHEADDVTSYVLFTDTLIALVKEKGGRITVLQDVNEESSRTIRVSKDVTLDLAGKSLYGIIFYSEIESTITVIDSSDDKSGVWRGYSRYDSYVYGTLTLEGITIESADFIVLDDGALVINNVICQEWIDVKIEYATVEINTFDCGGQLRIELDCYFEEIDFEINDVTIEKLTMTTTSSQDVCLNMLLPEGYAFAGEGGVLDGSGGEVVGITAIVEHTQHNSEKLQSSSTEHWISCSCGYNGESVRELHILSDDGLCRVCNVSLVASVTANGSTKYFTSLVDALLDTNNYQESTVVLLADFKPENYLELQLRKNVTIDLNGFTYNTNGRLMPFAGLTINDSSEKQTGKLYASGDISYIIEFRGGSNVTINGGEYFGLIYGATYNSETATITINGGRYLGAEKFRLNQGVKIIVNGGVFEGSSSVFNHVWSSKVEYEINGGVFINSTVFYVSDSGIPDIESMVGTDGECELWFISTSGKVLTVQELCDYYEGEILVFHKDTNGWASSTKHGQFCQSCEAYSIGIEHTVAYEPSNDGLSHSSYCVYCDWQLTTNEQHTGGEATCTDKAQCEYCSALYGDEPEGHKYDNDCDGECNVCGDTRKTPDHVYDNDCDKECNVCNEARETPDHVYDNDCDKECNECNEARKTPDHVYDNDCDKECNECNEARETPDHVYENECDKECNECNEARETPDHVYENACDKDCGECGYTRETSHSYTNGACSSCGAADPDYNTGATDDSTSASGDSSQDTNDSAANSSTADSNNASNKPDSNTENNDNADNGIGAGAIVGIVIGSLAVLGGGFAVFWFIRKKKFSNV